jgi:sporulation protein YlmC with PRC-barrel domain
MQQHPQVLSATSIIGKKVIQAAGEQPGNSKERIIDLDHGQIACAVLSFGGFRGSGDKLFAIPWEALTFNNMEDHTAIPM